ncbi:MAG: hypothetical protein DRR19_20450 [Candidatus Parabeggiatoa sp. nov. 1]|nr:MAG: hypothetical protein DRR19_20450 [Gammaproteobacteria bacterium]
MLSTALTTYQFLNLRAENTQRYTVLFLITYKNPILILCGTLWYSVFSVLKNSLFYKLIGVK